MRAELLQAFPYHPVGTYFGNGIVAYVNIPKCGSSSVKEALRLHGVEQQIYPEAPLEEQAVFSVVRNPLTRFVSGLLQHYAKIEDKQLASQLLLYYESLLAGEPPVLDEHTVPQWQFLEPFQGTEIELFPFVDFEKQTLAFFRRHGIVTKMPRLNVTAVPRQQVALELISPDVIEIVNDYYEQDWELYETCRFTS